MKLLIKVALSLLAVAAAGILAIFVYFDTIVGAAIETGCTRALGLETRVGWVRIGIFTGKIQIGRLRIDNPPGFETDHFFSFDRVHFEVPPASLKQDTIVVPLLEIDGIDVSLEYLDGKANYDVVLDNLNRFSSGDSADPSGKETATENDGSGKSFVIREAVIRDIDATIDLGKVSGGGDRVGVKIPEIKLRPNASTGSAGASVGKLTQVIVAAVLTAVAKKAPVALAKGLSSGLGALKDISLEIPGSLSKTGGSVGDATKKLGEGAKNAVQGLGGLFGGGDEDR